MEKPRIKQWAVFNRSFGLLFVFFLFVININANSLKIIVLTGEAKWLYKEEKITLYNVNSGFTLREKTKVIIKKSGSCIFLYSDRVSYLEVKATNGNRALDIDSLILKWSKSCVKLPEFFRGYNEVLKNDLDITTNEIRKHDYTCMHRYPHESRCPPNIRFVRPYNIEKFSVYGDEVYFSWAEDSAISNCTYSISLKNFFDDEIMSEPATQKSYMLNLRRISLSERSLIFGVTYPCACCNQTDELQISILKGAEKDEITLLKKDLLAGDYWQMLLEARIYEDRKLFLDAFTVYRKMQLKFPDYQNNYFLLAQFLERNRVGYPCNTKPIYFMD